MSADALDVSDIDAPIILIGRGGSGTRLLSQLVQSGGVFLGNKLNVSFDSQEWPAVLYPLSLEATALSAADQATRAPYWRTRLRQLAKQIIAESDRKAGQPWGWKLPETILALPHVLRSFPQARIVHIVRHPVTSSLRRTHRTSRPDDVIGRFVLPAGYFACGRDLSMLKRDEPYIHNAVSWAYQIRKALDALAADAPSSITIRYEDLCRSPAEIAERLSRFLGVDLVSTVGAIEIDGARTGPSHFDPVKAEMVWSICGPAAAALGYDFACDTGIAHEG